jgi:hypothetical protein
LTVAPGGDQHAVTPLLKRSSSMNTRTIAILALVIAVILVILIFAR